MGGQPGEPGLESPPGQQMVEKLGVVAGGYGMGSMGATIAKALAQKGLPMAEGLGEAGALFPEESLPVMPRGAKTGDPHALYAYHDDFGPEGTKRAMFNVFGDPSNPAVKQAGWGSSITEAMLKKFGIPIVGREPPRAFK